VGDVRRLIAFDLDGTLIDSRRDLADSANALIVELGGTPLTEDDIARMVGEGAAVLVRRALTAAGVRQDLRAALARFLEIYDTRLLHHTRAYAGIEDAVREARTRGRVVVLTNKPKKPSEVILEGLGLRELFDEVIGGDGPLPRKPDPASLLRLMDDAGATPAGTVMIGDSWVDYETARAAGTAICLARYGFGYEAVRVAELRGDEGLVDEPSQLVAAIDRLLAR
jgi:phosphoglycolate phosphatase